MKKRIILYAIITSVCSIIAIKMPGQTRFQIYETINWKPYFKVLGTECQCFYYSYQCLKDSLPDGEYTFYSFAQKDSSKKELSRRIIMGEYKNGHKSGLFKTIEYKYDKKIKKYVPISVETCNFINGLEDGYAEQYMVINFELHSFYIMQYYCEYKKGKKDGIEMYYNEGYPCEINKFENDTLKEKLMSRNFKPK